MLTQQVCEREELGKRLQSKINQLLGCQVAQSVRIFDRGTVHDLMPQLDAAQSFPNLVARSVFGRRLAVDAAGDQHVQLAQEAERAATEMLQEHHLPDALLPGLMGVQYWRLLEHKASGQSIFDLVLTRIEGRDGEAGVDMPDPVTHALPLGLLKDEPGTFAFLLIE